MKKSLKKPLLILLALLAALSCLTAGAAFADTTVAISADNFPDSQFRAFISERCDTDGDGYLSESERSITLLSATEAGTFADMTGIEYFTSLKVLRCGNVGCEKLDVSALTELTTLTCPGNYLETLDLTNNFELVTLDCSDNDLTALDIVSSNMQEVYCSANYITSLDMSYADSLEVLYCDQNELSSLDVSLNTALNEFNCSTNHLTDIDLSNNTELGTVTSDMIADQTISLDATFEGTQIVIPFTQHSLTSDNFVSCSLDDVGGSFLFTCFIATDVSQIDSGIYYYCSTGLSSSENMRVDATVTRDFYQVNYYSDEAMTESIGIGFANSGEAAEVPKYTAPQCKKLDSWSESIESVTADMSVYAVWADDHQYALSGFADDTATVKCSVCGDSFELSFIEAVNSETGDEKYSEYLDVVSDGVINAKDYAKLIKTYK